MSNVLMVSVHLDALLLERDRSMVEAMADFARLPYFDGHRDINPDVAYLSESVSSKPFQNQNLSLKAGIHLHWALPDALTQGHHSSTETVFPAVPNRWLVTRSLEKSIEAQWIVESDYVWDAASDNPAGSVNIPGNAGEPWRYLGRKIPLALWREDGSRANYLTTPLTAVAYGEPTFAAFYPNCHSVFGFYDNTYTDSIPTGLQYDAIGWYSDLEVDYLNTVIASNGLSNPHDILAAIETQLQWTTNLESNLEFPQQMLCYGRLTFAGKDKPTENPALNAPPPTIAIGNTGTEALSAYLAHSIDSKHKSSIEDRLEALQFSARLESRQLDIGAKFQEARHEKGFTAIDGGTLWTIRPQTDSTAPDTQSAPSQMRLLPEIAGLLDDLNSLQQAYDRANDEIASLRKQLFSDWYKYLLCAYPPEGSQDDYPDIDLVKHYLTVKGLAVLQAKIAETGTIALQIDRIAGKITATTTSPPSALASQLAIAINRLVSDLDIDPSSRAVGQLTTTYILKPTPSPRYWQPNEPVVLIVGEAVEPSPRYGQDGRLRADGLLECHILKDIDLHQSLIPDLFAKIQARIDEIQQDLAGNSITFSTWTQQPWHPILLEWEVEVFPTKYHSNLVADDRDYDADFITSNYTIAENAPDLSAIATTTSIAPGANIYSGRSILTPYASIPLKNSLEEYLSKQLLPAYFQTGAVPPAQQSSFDLSIHIQELRTWYETTNQSALDSPEQQALDGLYSAILAYQSLQTLNCLSQSLGGFNEALLMHQQTMQLPIADPLGFDDDREFVLSIRNAIETSTKSAPTPLNDFNPIRSGNLKLLRLRLVDSFGRVKDLDVSDLLMATPLTTPDRSNLVSLPPRLTQPACLNFRWLAASQDGMETNAHPDTTPICGWILPNYLDNSLAIYDERGRSLGSIERAARWRAAPGQNEAINVEEIANVHLRKAIEYLLARGETFIDDFISAVDTALANIDPENSAQHQSLALLMGRPLAIVRATIDLELQGLPAINQDWNVFRQDLRRNTRETNGFTQVNFPIRIGEYQQFNDGLVGYWLESADGDLGKYFYAPQSTPVEDDSLVTRGKDPVNIDRSIDASPQTLMMLVDPRGQIHATSGILPTKAIEIPPAQYSSALKAIEITFLTAPILTDFGQMKLPLPAEPGFAWDWIDRRQGIWSEISTTPTLEKSLFTAKFGEVIWAYLLMPQTGWLQQEIENNSLASIVPSSQRKLTILGTEFISITTAIETILDLDRNPTATITRSVFLDELSNSLIMPIWAHLGDPAIGWLKNSSGDPNRAIVVAKDSRISVNLGETFAGMTELIKTTIERSEIKIDRPNSNITFAPQEICEGWLKLSSIAESQGYNIAIL